ncbi:hypothetical protein MMC25_003375 [Agyrium rufum]|nr:hypothetical protein [Agyrium rufum]
MANLFQRLYKIDSVRIQDLVTYSRIIVIGFCCAHFVSDTIGFMTETAGPSMLPTINVRKDYVLISRLHRRGRGIEVGDVVGALHPTFPGVEISKRVLGMPGDFIVTEAEGMPKGSMIQIPEGHCWLEGDNKPYSRDSRIFGPVPLALIRGKVIARVRPLSQMKWMKNTLQPVVPS